jgi:beta-glucanase (GH16 family)
MNIGCLFILLLGVLCLFAGYPIISYYTGNSLKTGGAYNLGGINGTGQVPLISNFPTLIDADTPDSAKTRTGFDGNDDWELVFSDEFNKDGRTFFDGGESTSASDSEHELSTHMESC